MARLLNLGSAFTIGATFVLFVIAAIVKGFTHDLLLEGGVFLVSLKLIISSTRQSIAQKEVIEHLESIERQLREERLAQESFRRSA